ARALRAIGALPGAGVTAAAGVVAATGGAAHEGTAQEPTAEEGSARSATRRRRPWLALLGALCFVVVVGVLVGRFAAARLPGQTVTGTERVDAQQSLAERLVQGRELVAQGRDGTALALFHKILSTDPGEPEALAYEGWLLRLAGDARHDHQLVEQGRSYISQAITADPGYPDAHVFLGYILLQDESDLRDALIQFRLFLADHPATALVSRTAAVIDGAFTRGHLPPPIPHH
ncbi:MAG: tetratricopeptide repeat protein, partial [Acidimicrobiales bacterium]